MPQPKRETEVTGQGGTGETCPCRLISVSTYLADAAKHAPTRPDLQPALLMNPTLPADLEAKLTRWTESLATALDHALQAVVLYGGLAKGEFVAETSDVNVLVVLRHLSTDVLDRAAPILQQGQFEFHIAAMLLTEADLRDSADVFPIKFLDMQRHHRVLRGNDPFAQVAVERSKLRLRCEQELRNLSLRLRQSYVARTNRPELLAATLGRAVSSLLVNLGVLVELKTGTLATTKQQTLADASVLGLPLDAIRQAWAVKRGEATPEPTALRQLYATFMTVVQQAADLATKLT